MRPKRVNGCPNRWLPAWSVVLPLFLWCCVAWAESETGDWAQWRGAQRDGHTDELGELESWPDRLSRSWSIEVGVGQSSPVVSGNLVVLFDRNGDQERVSAFRLESGEEVWTRGDSVKFKPGMGGGHYGAGPKSTPVVSDGKVVTYGVKSLLTIRELETGKLIWRRDLHDEFEDPTLYWGNSMSPIVAQGQVVVQFGNHKAGGVLSYDLETGEERWRIEGYGNSYSSPILIGRDAEQHLALMTWLGPVGVSFEGEVLWEINEPMSFSRQNTATPVFRDGLLVFSSEKRPLRAERLRRAERGWTTSTEWARDDLPLDMASPVAFDDRICGVTTRQRGQLVCVDLATGKDLFRGPARVGDFAILLVSPVHLLVVTPEGRLQVLGREAEDHEVLHEIEIAESEIWAHPAVVRSGMVIKTYDRLEHLKFETAP